MDGRSRVVLYSLVGSVLLVLSSAPPLVTGARGLAGVPQRTEGAASALGSTSVHWGGNFSIATGYNASVDLTAQVVLPEGSIDVGSRTSVNVTVLTPSEASVTVDVGGQPITLPIPALGTIGPFEIPGINYSYLGIPFHVYAELQTSIAANCSSVPAESGCSDGLHWTSAGGVSIALVAPGGSAAVGGSISFDLTSISYVLALNLTARGTVPVLGNVTVPVPLPVPIPNLLGTPDQLSSSLTVTAAPAILGFTANPASVATGEPSLLSVNASGGSGPLDYRYSNLPSGCPAANASRLICTPSSAGTFSVGVNVSDPQGYSAYRTLELRVGGSSSASAHPASGGGISLAPWQLSLLLVGAVAGGVVVALGATGRLRRRPRPPASPPGPGSA